MNKKSTFPSEYYELTVLVFSTYKVNISPQKLIPLSCYKILPLYSDNYVRCPHL